jgi:hypothetical protein
MSANAEDPISSAASASTLDLAANTCDFNPRSSSIVGLISLSTVGQAPGPLLDTILDNGINQAAKLELSNGVTKIVLPFSGNGSTHSADTVREDGGAQSPDVVSDNITTENNDTGRDNGTSLRARSDSDKSVDQSTGRGSDSGTTIVDSGSNHGSIRGPAPAQSSNLLSNHDTNAEDGELDAIVKAPLDAVYAGYPSFDHKANDFFREGLENLANTQPPYWLPAELEQDLRAIAQSNPHLHRHDIMQMALIQMWLMIQCKGQASKGLAKETTRVCKELEKKQREVEQMNAKNIIVKAEYGDKVKTLQSLIRGLTRKHDEQCNAYELAMEKLKLENAQLAEQAMKLRLEKAQLIKQAEAGERAKDEIRDRVRRLTVLEEKLQRRADNAAQEAEQREQEMQQREEEMRQLKERNQQLEEEFKLLRAKAQQSKL